MEMDEAQRSFSSLRPRSSQDQTCRKDSSFSSFARKMSIIMLGDEGNIPTCSTIVQTFYHWSDALRRRRRSRRSPNPAVLRDGSKQRKSLSPLQGRKIHLDISKRGLKVVQRERSFLETTLDDWMKSLKELFGWSSDDYDEADDIPDVNINSMKQLQQLCAPHRHRPASVESLVDETGFSKEEVKMMYRGFKTECPSGVLTEECFHNVYLTLFPGRDETYTDTTCSFTHYIYSLLDKKCTGFVTFEVE